MTIQGPFTLFKEAVRFYKVNYALLVGIVLIPAAVDICSSILALETIGDILSFVVSIFAYIALIIAIDNPTGIGTIQNAYRASGTFFFRYLFVSMITGFLIVLGLFALLLPGFLFMVWFAFAAFVVVLEKRDVFDSIKLSREYARGKWSAIFGRLIVLGLLVCALITPIAIMFSATGIRELGMYLLAWLITPLTYIYLYLLYKEVKRS